MYQCQYLQNILIWTHYPKVSKAQIKMFLIYSFSECLCCIVFHNDNGVMVMHFCSRRLCNSNTSQFATGTELVIVTVRHLATHSLAHHTHNILHITTFFDSTHTAVVTFGCRCCSWLMPTHNEIQCICFDYFILLWFVNGPNPLHCKNGLELPCREFSPSYIPIAT